MGGGSRWYRGQGSEWVGDRVVGGVGIGDRVVGGG